MNHLYKKLKAIFGGSTKSGQSIVTLDTNSGNLTLVNGLNQTIFQINDLGQWLYLNAEWEKLTGFPVSETLGTDVINHVHPDDKKQCADFIQSIYGNAPLSFSNRVRFLTRDADLCWVNMRANSFINPADNKIHLVGVISDITDRVREYGLHQANYRTLHALINNLCGLVYRGRNDHDWTMEFVSDGAFELTGYHPSELINKTVTFGSLINPNDQDLVWTNVQSALRENRAYDIDYRIRTSNGQEKWVWERGKGNFFNNGELLGIEGLIVDITDYKRSRIRKNEEVLYRTKTKLPQKNLFLDRLRLTIERAKLIDNYGFALLIIHIDRFKNLQDRFPANIIDRIITEVSEKINAIVNPANSLCLFDEGEFALILEHAKSINPVRKVIKSIHNALLAPVKIDNVETYLTVSIGIYLNTGANTDRKSVVKDAYTALNRAKSLGGSRYEMHDEAINARIYALDRMEKEIHCALENNELLLCYQPVMPLKNKAPISLEAQLFWNHPRRGKISSGFFSPISACSEIVNRLNSWIIGSVIKQAKIWESQADFEKKLNISIRFFGEDMFADSFLNRLEGVFLSTTFSQFKFLINIPANSIQSFTDHSIATLYRLNKQNIGFTITTNKSTLPSGEDLSAINIDSIKLNNPFLVDDGKKLKIAKNIATAQIDYLHALGKKVIIIGAETKEQLDLIKELACDYIQGNIVSPPLDRDNVVRHITQNNQDALSKYRIKPIRRLLPDSHTPKPHA